MILMNKEIKGYFQGVLSAVVLAIQFILTKLLLERIYYANLILFQFSIGTIIVFLITIFKFKKIPFGRIWMYKKDIFLAGVSIGIASILWVYSVDLIGPAMTSFIQKLNIPFSIILGIILLKERLVSKEIIGILIAIIGVILISYNRDFVIFASVIFAVFQAVFFSFHSFFVKRVVEKIDVWLILLGRCFVAVIVIFIFGIFTRTLNFNYNLDWKWIIILVLSPLFGIVLNNYFRYNSLKLIGLSKNAVVSSLEPVLITFLSIIFLKLDFTVLKYIGGAVIIFGLYIVIMAKKNNKAVPEEFE